MQSVVVMSYMISDLADGSVIFWFGNIIFMRVWNQLFAKLHQRTDPRLRELAPTLRGGKNKA